MPLQIANFNIELNLTGIPANRAYSPSSFNSSLLLPNNQNRFIKKISINSIYNNQGDIIVNYYAINFRLINFDNIILENSTPIITSGFSQTQSIIYEINKNKPIININEFAEGINFNTTALNNTLILNNSVTPIASTVSFLLSIYYDI
jgi:hypothetical protein